MPSSIMSSRWKSNRRPAKHKQREGEGHHRQLDSEGNPGACALAGPTPTKYQVVGSLLVVRPKDEQGAVCLLGEELLETVEKAGLGMEALG